MLQSSVAPVTGASRGFGAAIAAVVAFLASDQAHFINDGFTF